MKIAHVVPGPLYRGGVGTLVVSLCESLAEQGHSVTAYYVGRTSIHQDEEKVVQGVMVKGFKPIIGDPLFLPSRGLKKALSIEKADIIHVHNIQTLLPSYIALLKNCLPAKMILQPHYHEWGQNIVRNALFSLYKKALKVTVLRFFNAVIVNSEYEKNNFGRDFPSISSKVVLVPEEYSLTVPPHAKWKTATQSRLLYVGGLSRYKNVETLIRAFKILTPKRKDIELTIIGDGPEKQKLMKLAFSLGVNDKTTFKHGLSHDELLQHYATTSAVVLLSPLESFSRVAHEAIAVGTPLIVYDYGPLIALVKKGSAKGVKSLDPKKVADVIDEVLDSGWRPAKPRLQLSTVAYVELIIRLYESLL